MTPKRWLEVERLFHLARERDADKRAAFLEHACGGDRVLQQEVKSLLTHAEGADRYLEGRALDMAARQLAQDRARPADTESIEPFLVRGRTISHYRLIEKVGAGGMGEVYCARDTRLGRMVALKILPPDLATDPEIKRRFLREAKAASALNDPRIVTLYDVGSEDGIDFLVMEYVQGETLDKLIPRAGLEIKQALRYAIDITGALATAHQAGIVHRDLKPGNVMVTEDGAVKVLDFGLAKLTEPLQVSASEEQETLISSAGLILGTVAYMSPEQAQGRPADARSDIFSFGVMLYEMLVGQRPSQGTNHLETLALIVHQEPKPLTELKAEIPGELERAVLRCLRKDPNERFQEMADVRVALEGLMGETSSRPRVPGNALARRSWIGTAVAALAAMVSLLVAAAATYFYPRWREPPLTERDSIVLADFENRTGDTVFDDTLKKALEVKINQSPYLNVLADQKVRQTLEYMRRSPEERLTKQVSLEVCNRNGVKALVSGSIATLGTHYIVTLEALNCATRDVVAETQAEAESKEHVLRGLDQCAARLRRKLGESLGSIQRFDAPVEQVTTSSLDALKAFAHGDELRRRGKYDESLLFFKRAIEIDPLFALAYGRLGSNYVNLREFGMGQECLKKAYQLRARVSERERFYLACHYYDGVTGEVIKDIENDTVWTNTYPRDWVPFNNLANQYTAIGQYDKAITTAVEALRLNPGHAFPYIVLARAYKCANRFNESKGICERAIGQKLDDFGIHSILYQIAFAEGDVPMMNRQVEWGAGKPTEGLAMIDEASAAACAGKLRESRELSNRAFDVGRRQGSQDSLADAVLSQAESQAAFGNFTRAHERARAVLALAPSAEFLAIAAIALARCGDLSRAESIATDLGKRFPLNTIMNEVILPVIRATVEIRRRQPARAVELLRAATPYELHNFLVPYTRGSAYLLAADGKQAAVEFHKILDNQGVDPISVYFPLAHVGLARAYALQNDKANSRLQYEHFFAAWREADRDIPILREARREYASLK